MRLYCGIVRNGVWYNHADIEEIKGGTLAVLDGVDTSGAARLLNLVKGAVTTLTSDDHSSYPLTASDYETFKAVDCWKVALEVQKAFQNDPSPAFEEYFFCRVCSHPGHEKYTMVKESWHDLIEKGIIDEHYAETSELSFWTTLPVGVTLEGSRTCAGGVFTKIKREPVSIGDLIKLRNTPSLMDNESNMINALWDSEITGIEGMTEKDLNIYVKRNMKDSFCKKYLIHQADIDAMSEEPHYGLDARYREVRCKYCHHEIGGYLDFTNFFEFLFQRKGGQRAKAAI